MNNTDPYAGMGGSYLLDPKTGKRTQISPPTAPETPAAVVADEQSTEADVAIIEEN